MKTFFSKIVKLYDGLRETHIFILGLMIRIPLAPFTNSFDFTGWRIFTEEIYYYPLDIINYSSYSPLWIITPVAVYPIYLIISLFYQSLLVERLILKFPVILSDSLISIVLFRIIKSTEYEDKAKFVSLLWALNPYAIWICSVGGKFDSIPTLFILLSLSKFNSGKLKTSAIHLSVSIAYKLYSLILVPIFLISIYKREGKDIAMVFSKILLLSTLLLTLPWKIPFTYTTPFISQIAAPPEFEPTLSYWYLLESIELQSFRIYFFISLSVFGITLLSIHLFKRNNDLNIFTINNYIVLALVLVYLTHSIIFAMYVIWSLPFLFISTFVTKDIPKRLLLLFVLMPPLWAFGTNPLVLHVSQTFQTSLWPVGGEAFRKAFAMNFSLLCIVIITLLVRRTPPTNISIWNTKSKEKRFNFLNFANIVAVLCGIFLVFNPWLINHNWMTLWNSVLKYIIFYSAITVLLISLVVVVANMRNREPFRLNDLTKSSKIAIIGLLVLWIYTISLFVSMVLKSLNSGNSQIYSELYFSYLLILWIPLIVYSMLRAQPKTLFSSIYLVFLQVSFLITRHDLYYETLKNLTVQMDLLLILLVLVLILIPAAYAYPIEINESKNQSSF